MACSVSFLPPFLIKSPPHWSVYINILLSFSHGPQNSLSSVMKVIELGISGKFSTVNTNEEASIINPAMLVTVTPMCMEDK